MKYLFLFYATRFLNGDVVAVSMTEHNCFHELPKYNKNYFVRNDYLKFSVEGWSEKPMCFENELVAVVYKKKYFNFLMWK